jgi:predicted transcriptional regulator
MSEEIASLKDGSESIRISKQVKRRLQAHCRQHNQSLRRMLDQAVSAYVQRRRLKE